ncbi:MAG: InlB B-repeat-containing protein [Clostridium sp.]|nr:MAG: InlB B-repeat-containing protein [Clostridium sp.]
MLIQIIKIYYFKGWSYENGEIAKIGDTLSNNVVLTAIWEEDTTKYIITLDPLDGTLSTTTYEGLFGTMIDSEPKPILEGFRFVGWYHNDELVLFPYKNN